MVDSWRLRIEDMRALADFVAAPRYLAVGHSYGALTALTLGGVGATVPPGVTAPLRDPRAVAALAYSPPGVAPGLISAAGYAKLAVPALIQTGDRDVPMMMRDARWQSHLASFDAAPPGDKYALVLDGVDHYFGGLICQPDKPGPPAVAQLAIAVRIGTDFLAAYGTGDRAARRRLAAARGVHGPARLTKK